MDLENFLKHLNSGMPVIGESDVHQFMHGVSQEALKYTAELNSAYHTPEEIILIMETYQGFVFHVLVYGAWIMFLNV